MMTNLPYDRSILHVKVVAIVVRAICTLTIALMHTADAATSYLCQLATSARRPVAHSPPVLGRLPVAPSLQHHSTSPACCLFAGVVSRALKFNANGVLVARA